MGSAVAFLTEGAVLFFICYGAFAIEAIDASDPDTCNVTGTSGKLVFQKRPLSFKCSNQNLGPPDDTSIGNKSIEVILRYFKKGRRLWTWNNNMTKNTFQIIRLSDHYGTFLYCEARQDNRNATEEVILCVHESIHPPNISGSKDIFSWNKTTISCEANNSYTALDMNWFVGSLSTTLNAPLHTAFNESSFTPSRHDSGQDIICRASEEMLNTTVFLHLHNETEPDEPSAIIVDRQKTTTSSLFVSWQLGHGNASLLYCGNSSLDNVQCKNITGLSGSSYNLTGLEPFQWYNLTLLADGSPEDWKIASTSPPSPGYYGVYMTYSPEEDILKISKLPITNRTVPSDLCFAIQTQDQKTNCSSSSVECKVPNGTEVVGVHAEQIKAIGLVSSGRGFCSLPSQPIILNSTHGKMDMPHVSIIMGAVLGTSISILLSSVALLLLLNFICKGISCLGKKEEDINEDETLVRVIRKDNSRKVDKDGLVYVEIAHNNTHPADAPPIRTEEPTVYALLDAGAMGTYKKDDDGLVYVEVSHDHAHPPGAPPIQTEKPTVYASLDMEAMATRKEREEKEEEKVEEKEEEKEEKSGVKDEKEGVNNERKSVQKETEGVKEETEGVKEEKEKVKEVNENDKKAPEEQSPPITKLPNYENITLTEDDGLALPSTLETRL